MFCLKIPFYSWHKYVSHFFNGIYEIPESEVVIIRDPKYFEALGKIIDKTEPEVLSDYLLWRSIKFSMTYMNKEAAKIKQNFKRVARGQKKEKALWKKCADLVGFGSFRKKGVNLAAASLYVKKSFKPEAKEAMDKMVVHLKRAFREVVDEIDWMDEDTKVSAYEKLDSMKQVIAYPEEILDNDMMNDYHKDLIEALAKIPYLTMLEKRMETNRYMHGMKNLHL